MLDSQDKDFVIRVIGKALVGLLDRQTSHEQKVADTVEDNGIGFTGADAHYGTINAKAYLRNKTLRPEAVAAWTKKNAKGYSRLAKYHSQLNEIAIEKAGKKNAI